MRFGRAVEAQWPIRSAMLSSNRRQLSLSKSRLRVHKDQPRTPKTCFLRSRESFPGGKFIEPATVIRHNATWGREPKRTPGDIDEAIDLPASILGRAPILWESESLHTAVANHFVSQNTFRVNSPNKLKRLFTAHNLGRISEIRIRWTTTLADHLRFVNDNQAVFIFYYTSILNFQLRQEPTSKTSNLRNVRPSSENDSSSLGSETEECAGFN
ncbi:hypothetical protein B0T25DRAFT_53354 [Lasiosphaeria hispida]|uniref:Uncharacterized protein n=1 Tax=Lasiosphaeria hispida TaxID=260671 RepID=A0AAJ0HVY7_9PEZI|nr:hypothetical protein B0T25DRAFT_53354 [Lasiosphaeria hispida]